MEFVEVGKIVNTFGIKGELKVVTESEFIANRFAPQQTLYVGKQKTPVVVKSYRLHQGNVLLLLKEVNDINQVLKYVDEMIYVSADSIEDLPDGYYLFQLIGLKVLVNNEVVGEVIDAYKQMQTLLKIKTADKEVLIPYVPAFVKAVDLNQKTITIEVITGLL